MIKNKKGFTLVELIMVIVVIGIIAMIAIQSVTKRIADSKERAYNIQVNNIENAAKKYMLESEKEDEYHLNTLCISISMLQDKGYLEKGNIKNPKTDENFNVTENFVKIKYNFDRKQYEYNFTNDCTPIQKVPAARTIIDNNSNAIKINLKDDGLYELIDSYVFRGVKPNNYIEISDRMWRIVSIDKSTMMIKVVYLNDNQKTISEKGILKDLNDDYETGTTYQETFKAFVNTNSKWNSGVVNKLNSALSLKSIEKQSNVYNTIGLLTVGDYVDASIVKNCHITNTCTSYLSTNKNYWLLNNTNDNKTWYVNASNQLLSETQSTQLYNVYPCLYLKTNSVISSGTGTETDPYILK